MLVRPAPRYLGRDVARGCCGRWCGQPAITDWVRLPVTCSRCPVHHRSGALASSLTAQWPPRQQVPPAERQPTQPASAQVRRRVRLPARSCLRRPGAGSISHQTLAPISSADLAITVGPPCARAARGVVCANRLLGCVGPVQQLQSGPELPFACECAGEKLSACSVVLMAGGWHLPVFTPDTRRNWRAGIPDLRLLLAGQRSPSAADGQRAGPCRLDLPWVRTGGSLERVC